MLQKVLLLTKDFTIDGKLYFLINFYSSTKLTMKNFQIKSNLVLPAMKNIEKAAKPILSPNNYDFMRSQNSGRPSMSPYRNGIENDFSSSINSHEKTPLSKFRNDQGTKEQPITKELEIERLRLNSNLTPINFHSKVSLFSPHEKATMNTISAVSNLNSSSESK